MLMVCLSFSIRKDEGYLSLRSCHLPKNKRRQVKLKSKGTLAFHLKHFHRDQRPYCCDICMNSFNNKYDLSSHYTNVHTPKAVVCKYCTYHTTLKAQMRLHVRAHTMGAHCNVCSKAFPHKCTLGTHKALHSPQQEFPCTQCDLSFATHSSRNIHVKGKHGPGYVCPCGASFESPAQHARHKKCKH